MKYKVIRKLCPLVAIEEGNSPKKVLEDYLENFYLLYSHEKFKGRETPKIEIKVTVTKGDRGNCDYCIKGIDNKRKSENFYKVKIEGNITPYTPATISERKELKEELDNWLKNQQEDIKYYNIYLNSKYQ